MTNKEANSLVKPTAYLINTAREEVVETKDIYEALAKSQIAGATIDVYEEEPPVKNPLLSLPNVVTTSHIGAFSKETMIRQSMMSTRNTIMVLKGEMPEGNVANPQVWRKRNGS